MRISNWAAIGLVAIAVGAASAEAGYTIRNCGTLGGNQAAGGIPGTLGWDISDSNRVVGSSVYTTSRWRAFRYEYNSNTISMLSYPSGYSDYGSANAISPNGKKVAGQGFATGNAPAVLWTNNGTVAWAAVALPYPGGSASRIARDVNNGGVVVGDGYGWSGYGDAPVVWYPSNQGAGWTYDAVTDYSQRALPNLPGTPTGFTIDGRAYCVYSNGLIGGYCEFANNNNHAAVWRPDGSGGYTAYHLYVTAPGETTQGRIYGIAWDKTLAKYRAVGAYQVSSRYRPWSWTYDSVGDKWDSQGTLGTLYSAAADENTFDVNESGVAVGQSLNAAGAPRAFIWDAQRGMRDLNTLLEGPEVGKWVLLYATGINAGGSICGTGYYDVNGDSLWATDGSETRAFVLVYVTRGTMLSIR